MMLVTISWQNAREGGQTMMKRILCIGDSNTWGYDPRSWLGSQYPANVRWTGLLEQSGWTVFNYGQNGASIPGKAAFPTVSRLIKSRLPVDVVTVMLGSNDLLEGIAAEKVEERMERFLACVTEAAPEASLLLIAPPVMKLGAWVPSMQLIEESSRLSGLYQELAAAAGTEFADADTWGIDLTFDGVHFSPEGHRAFARGLAEALEKL